MTKSELLAKLNDLMALPTETEWVEFKEARSNFDFDDLGRYFSALSQAENHGRLSRHRGMKRGPRAGR